MASVYITRAAYDQTLTATIHDILDRTVPNRVTPGTRVLIKPNLLQPARPDRGIVTHPLVVRAVAEWVLEKGGHVQVSDSPAIGPFNKVLKDGGFFDTCRGMPIQWQNFTRALQVDIGPPFGRIDLAADALESDLVVNLAKLKTHVMMRMTLGVKNMFGCVIGMKKTQWHLRAGVDKDLFARLLVQICSRVNPGVTLIDGIFALEGQGPGRSGSPRRLGILAASQNPVALDYTVSEIVGCPPETLPIHKAAVKMGLFNDPPDVIGDTPIVTGFRLPEMGSAGFGPKPIQKLMRKHLLQRPVVKKKLCQVCGVCDSKCPADAIDILSEGIMFNYDQCIRCYCCVEVCPHGALFAMEPLPGIMLRQLNKWNVRLRKKLRS